MICGDDKKPENLPDLQPGCCDGSSYRGPEYCTCWEPVYDLEQTQPEATTIDSMPRDEMCNDSAFRVDSPERNNKPGYNGSEAELQALVEQGQPFYCHQGLRKVIGWRHTGVDVVIPAETDADYDPPILTHSNIQIPYKADGSAGDICAGWWARYVRSKK